MRPTYEFPDFDSDLPVIAGFIDTSWHNDICPSMSRESAIPSETLILWCDYADQTKREDTGMARYALVKGEYGEVQQQTTLYEGEDIEGVLSALAANDKA